MRVFTTLLIFLVTLTVVSCRQTPAINIKARQDLEKYFLTGSYDVKVFGNVAYTNPRIVELQKKMADAIRQHSEWFAEYRQKFDFPLPYHPNLGLSPEEYKEYLILTSKSKPELQLTGVEKVEVELKKNSILFFTRGGLQFFNGFEIDLKHNRITMNGHVLEFLSTESVTDSNNVFRSPYSGYTWQFLEPGNAIKLPPEDYKKQNTSIYKVTIGQLETGNRTILIVKGLEFDNGQKVFDFEAPIVF